MNLPAGAEIVAGIAVSFSRTDGSLQAIQLRSRGRTAGSCFTLVILAVVMEGAAPRPAAAEVVIDDFEEVQDAQILSATLATSPVGSTLDHASILGGERDAQVLVTAAAGTMTVNTSDASGHVNHSQEAGLRGRTILTWDGNDNNAGVLNPIGLGAVNLSVPPNDAFLLRVISADVASQLQIRVYTDAANFSAATVAIPAGTTNTTLSIPFSSFFAVAGAGSNFASVGAIEMTVNSAGTPSSGLDIVLEYLIVGAAGTPVELLDFEVSR